MIESILILPLIFTMAFTPYFIGVNSLTYGRSRGYLLLLVFLILVVGVLLGGIESSLLTQLFVILSAGSFCISAIGLIESVLREQVPMKALIVIPSCVFIFFCLCILGFSIYSDIPLLTVMENEVVKMQPHVISFFEKAELDQSKDFFELKALVMQPKLFVNSLVTYGAGSFFDFIMLAIWINLFFLLRAKRVITAKNNGEFHENVLLNMKMPVFVKWLLVISFGAYIGFDYMELTAFTAISFIILNVVSAFYFFQGFGVYLNFLDFVKISGVIRTFLIILTVFSARLILIIIGFADEFIDFKKLMVKNN